ncbi:hemin-degrading factor [Rhizobium sp. TRM96647]|uniref:hemin-degrading factor n=1 Tax=unclassified Rhizobium TaxID=2613769 RepID=UPI0021E89DC5|nr:MULTISPECIES: ChuX/HutX family heme-like substrate-binding protein [unclassified Rhizobium]MCV3735749.1 hemin-degrading factor [Rhizobium sp. TRM96647]MCV3758589.1 hemin-degrading factor [Rhizobium sp. TRM96650]
MTEKQRPTPSEIRAYRAENPKLRERDVAMQLGISEAALIAAEVGLTAVRIDGSANRLLERAPSLGEVMVLTRNDSAVHEKIGVYEKINVGQHASIVLGENVDLRIFPQAWKHGFAVSKKGEGDDVRRSLQYFDAAGNAVQKIHLRPASNLDAYLALVDEFRLDDQSQDFAEVKPAASDADETGPVDVPVLRQNWSEMTDTHQFFGMLKKLKIGRREAVRSVGEDYAWQVASNAAELMLRASAERGTDIMCFVGNNGTIQIHTGPVSKVEPMGPWINVMDPTFHLHLRQDHISECWVVRKPTKDGHVTSLEAYDAKGEMIIQFFGKRKEGNVELAAWRDILDGLPRADASVAA